MKKNILTTKEMTVAALGIAVVYVATLYIKIPNALDGYFNLGDGFVMLFATVLSPWTAFLAGGLGSALADLSGGYAYYFLPTLCIKGLESVMISNLIHRYGNKVQKIAYLLAAGIMVSGYFFTKAYLKQSFAIAMLGVPENIVQSIIGMIIASLCFPTIQRICKEKK